jgi:hypothetical protein
LTTVDLKDARAMDIRATSFRAPLGLELQRCDVPETIPDWPS